VQPFAYWLLVFIVASGLLPFHGAEPGVEGREPRLPHYEIAVTFDPDERTMDGRLSLDWTNHTGGARDALYFRLYPNAGYYPGGGTAVSRVLVDGRIAAHGLHYDETVLQVEAAPPVDSGQRI